MPPPPSTMKRSNSSSGSGVPYPSSHVRSLSGSRQSLAMGRPAPPMFARTSSGANVAEPGLSSVKRASFQNAPPSAFKGYASGAKAGGGGNAEAEQRRSSMYRPRPSTQPPSTHPSFFQQAPQAAGVPRDPRPLRDRSFQTRIGQELVEFLGQHNFEMEAKHTLSPNFIKSPTQKDFNQVFQWLYHRIDPSYRFMKSIDQEVPPLLKQLRYPYEKSITKSQIAAVGGQNWGTFLGVLHWMMQLAHMLDGYASHRYDDACLEAGVDVSGDHIIFDFLRKAYAAWLNMDDDAGDDDVEQTLAPHRQAMAEAFQETNSRYESELEELEAESARLLKEMHDLEKATPDPKELDQHFTIMEEDKVKFEEYNALATQRCDKYDNRAQLLQDELHKLGDELREVEEERRALQQEVDSKGIGMQDIDRMTTERERLQKGIESASQRLEDVKRRVAEKETEASRNLDELERLVDEYNTRAYRNALIPSTAANAKGEDYELTVTVNESNFSSSMMKSSSYGVAPETERLLADPVTGYQPAQILNLDLRGRVKNRFAAFRKEISARRSEAMDTLIKDRDLLDGIREAIDEKKSEVEALEYKVRAAEEEYEKTREVTTTQKLASDAQIEKMEKELAKMRAALSESVQLMEQREMNTNIEYEQLKLQAAALRDELHTEIDRILLDVVKFKKHIQRGLEDYNDLVTDEMEKEFGTNDTTRDINL